MTAAAHAAVRTALLASVALDAAACSSPNGAPADAAVDAVLALDAVPGDAALDGSIGGRFDIAYVNELQVSAEIETHSGLVMVINRDTLPLSLDSVRVVSFSDDTPAAEWVLARVPASVKLAPGHAAGALSESATAHIVDSGLVSEPIGDKTLNFTMTFVFPPPAGLKFLARAVLEIDGTRVTLPFQYHITRSGTVESISAARVSSLP